MYNANETEISKLTFIFLYYLNAIAISIELQVEKQMLKTDFEMTSITRKIINR